MASVDVAIRARGKDIFSRVALSVDVVPARPRSAEAKGEAMRAPSMWWAEVRKNKALVDGPIKQGAFLLSAASRDGSSACAGRSEVELETGAAANLACSERQHFISSSACSGAAANLAVKPSATESQRFIEEVGV